MEFRKEVSTCYFEIEAIQRRRVFQRIAFLDMPGHLTEFIKILITERPPVRVCDAVLDTVRHTFKVLTQLAERSAREKGFPTYLRLPNEKKWNVCWINAFIQWVFTSGLVNQQSSFEPWQACVQFYKNLANDVNTTLQSAGLCALLYRMTLLNHRTQECPINKLGSSTAFSWDWCEIGGSVTTISHIVGSYKHTRPAQEVYLLCPAGHSQTTPVDDAMILLAPTTAKGDRITLQEVQALWCVDFIVCATHAALNGNRLYTGCWLTVIGRRSTGTRDANQRTANAKQKDVARLGYINGT